MRQNELKKSERRNDRRPPCAGPRVWSPFCGYRVFPVRRGPPLSSSPSRTPLHGSRRPAPGDLSLPHHPLVSADGGSSVPPRARANDLGGPLDPSSFPPAQMSGQPHLQRGFRICALGHPTATTRSLPHTLSWSPQSPLPSCPLETLHLAAARGTP